MDALQVLRFNRRVRRELYSCLRKLPDGVFTEDRRLSFGSIRNTLFHVARVEDYWVNDVLRERGQTLSREVRDTIERVEDLQRVWGRLSDETEAFIAGMNEEELHRVVEVNARGMKVRKTVEDYLFTFLIHEIYHKGEVLAALWQMDVEPPPVDFWRY